MFCGSKFAKYINKTILYLFKIRICDDNFQDFDTSMSASNEEWNRFD